MVDIVRAIRQDIDDKANIAPPSSTLKNPEPLRHTDTADTSGRDRHPDALNPMATIANVEKQQNRRPTPKKSGRKAQLSPCNTQQAALR